MRRMYSLEQIKTIALEKIEATDNLHVFENIVDQNGHKRFIEGDINLLDSVPSTLTKVYGKWSLSGSHLLIVLCIAGTNTTVINSDISHITLPAWIIDKIVPIASNQWVDNKITTMFGNDLSTQQLSVYLRKFESGIIGINCNSLTLTADRTGRISFDLLIDNE